MSLLILDLLSELFSQLPSSDRNQSSDFLMLDDSNLLLPRLEVF